MESGYCGAFLWKRGFLSSEEVREAASLAERLNGDRRPILDPAARRDGLEWFESGLGADTGIARKIEGALGASADILSFYYLEPGARLHPHRDLTGASMNARIRFHIPVVTNSAVDFRIGGKRVEMRPGDLWIVDTSYTHSVANDGDRTRVHIVVEGRLTEVVRAALPGGWRVRVHDLGFVLHLAGKFALALVVNSVTRPRYFLAQLRMVGGFVGWRVLGRPYRYENLNSLDQNSPDPSRGN